MKSISLLVQKKKGKTDFQDGGHGGHLGFLIETIVATFDLQVTLMLPTKFQVSWPFSSGEDAKIDFKDCCYGGHFGFLNGTVLAFFFTYKSPRCFPPSFLSIGLSVQEKKQKIDFQESGHGGHLGFPMGTILAIFDLQVTPMLPTKFQVN